MRTRCITFSAHEVRTALRNGGGQFRRPLKPQPPARTECFDDYFEYDGTLQFEAGYLSPSGDYGEYTDFETLDFVFKAPYAQGNTLVVRETWAMQDDCQAWDMPEAIRAYDPKVLYRADIPTYGGAWKSPTTMPADLSRLRILVTGLRIEPLHAVTEQDAIDEGIEHPFSAAACATTPGLIGTKPEDHGWRNYLWHGEIGVPERLIDGWEWQYSNYKEARLSFSSLWERYNALKGFPWVSNPWVLVTEYSVIAKGKA